MIDAKKALEIAEKNIKIAFEVLDEYDTKSEYIAYAKQDMGDVLYNIEQAHIDLDNNTYKKRQYRAGFKTGDIVRITRKATSYEDGWDDVWTPEMDMLVRRIGEIIFIDDSIKVRFNDGATMPSYNFPYFILEKVGYNGQKQNS